MTKSIKTGKDTWLCIGPVLNPANWPTVVQDGFETLGGSPASLGEDPPTYQPTPEEIHARDQAICAMNQWTRQCKTTASVTRGTETSDTSDDCNPDSTTVTKLVKSITFEAFNRKKTDGLPTDSIKALINAYESEGCLMVPVLWTDCPKDENGAMGQFMLATVTDLSITGNLNDPVSVSATLTPMDTPPRATGGEPMLNQFPVLCSEDYPGDECYYGEIARYNPDGVPAATISTGFSPPTPPAPTPVQVAPQRAKTQEQS